MTAVRRPLDRWLCLQWVVCVNWRCSAGDCFQPFRDIRRQIANGCSRCGPADQQRTAACDRCGRNTASILMNPNDIAQMVDFCHPANLRWTSASLQTLDSLCEVQERSVIAWGSRDCNKSMCMFGLYAPMAAALLKRPSFLEQLSDELLNVFT